MKIRRFFAPDIRQATRLVVDALGPEAVILSNRKVEGGVEIVAAVDFDETLLARQETSSPEENAPQAPALARARAQIEMFRAVAQSVAAQTTPQEGTMGATQLKTPPSVEPIAPKSDDSAPKSPAEKTRPTPEAAKSPAPNSAPKPASSAARPTPLKTAPPQRIPASEIPPGKNPPAVPPKTATTPRIPNYHAENAPTPANASTSTRPRPIEEHWVQDPVLAEMRRELKELRGLLEHQLSGLAWSETTRRTPVQAQLLRSLTELGLTVDIARELANATVLAGDFDTAWRHAMNLLAERLTIEEDLILEHGGVVALVGATGVGKTTTVAKLAAHYAMRHGRERVALVTTDSYRIGSQEQLRTFARILGVPMRVAADAAELTQTLEALSDCGLVLIDTAGMSQRDMRLSEQFATLRGAGREIRSYLVLSAITQRLGLEEVTRAFGEIRVVGCILTKLDEAASLGEAISVVIRHKLPISYLGIGQRVPEDLLPARAHNLVSRAVALLQQRPPDIEEESLAMAFGSAHRCAVTV